MMTSDTTARGTIILLASMVPSAPSGQRMEISQMPGAEMVPMPRFVKKPTNTMATMDERGDGAQRLGIAFHDRTLPFYLVKRLDSDGA